MFVMVNAKALMKEYVENGGYRALKLAKAKKDKIVSAVNKHLQHSEYKRHEFPKFGLVAKYTVKRDYEWDYEGLNDYLNDLGLLIPVAKLFPDSHLKRLELLDEVKDYQLPIKKYSLRPYFNKAGKAINRVASETLNVYDQMALDMLLTVFDAHQRELKFAEEDYELLKQAMLKCPELQEKKTVKYEYGSLSLLPVKEGYDVLAIAKDFGIDFLIQYSKPDMKKLQQFILRGTITQKEVYQFRKDVTSEDKGLTFTLMKLEDEHKQLQMLSDITLQSSLNYYRRA